MPFQKFDHLHDTAISTHSSCPLTKEFTPRTTPLFYQNTPPAPFNSSSPPPSIPSTTKTSHNPYPQSNYVDPPQAQTPSITPRSSLPPTTASHLTPAPTPLASPCTSLTLHLRTHHPPVYLQGMVACSCSCSYSPHMLACSCPYPHANHRVLPFPEPRLHMYLLARQFASVLREMVAF